MTFENKSEKLMINLKLFNTQKLSSLIVLIICIFGLNHQANSQEILSNVIVNKERLAQENMININSMERDLMNYINNQKFTDIEWEGPPIPIEINIVLSGGTNGNYTGQFLVIAKRYLNGNTNSSTVTLKLIDEQWNFNYSQGGFLTFNPLRFDNFVSLIDYYMLLIIGFDMDTYEELSGTKSYDLAKQICLMGASQNVTGYQTFTQPGEFNKFNLIKEFTDLRSEELRRIFFEFFVDGFDIMATNKEQGRKNLENAINNMANYKKDVLTGPSVVFQAFFDSKAQEIADIFKDYPDNKAVFDNLLYIDPGSATIYRDAMRK